MARDGGQGKRYNPGAAAARRQAAAHRRARLAKIAAQQRAQAAAEAAKRTAAAQAAHQAKLQADIAKNRRASNISAIQQQDTGLDAKEATYNLAKEAFGGDLQKGAGADSGPNTATLEQIDKAKNLLPQVMGTGEFANPELQEQKAAGKVAGQARMKEAIAKAESQGMTMNNMPVIVVNGNLQYDTNKIGEQLGMSPEAIKEAGINFGTRKLSPGKSLDNLDADQAYVGGVGDEEAKRRAQWGKGMKIGPNQAILSNLSQLKPTDEIDFTKEDVILNLAKPGFAWDAPGDIKRHMNQNQGPTGIGKFAGPAMKAAVGGMLSLVTGGAAAPAWLAPVVAGAYGAMSGEDKSLGGILKNAATGAGTSLVGSAAKGLSGFAAESLATPMTMGSDAASLAAAQAGTTAMTQGLASTIGNIGTKSLVSGLGNEAVSMIQDGKFDVGDALTGAATSAATQTATELGQSALEGTGLGDALGIGDTTPVEPAETIAPSALELGASPGDIGTSGAASPITVPNVDAYRLANTDMGFGTGAGIESGTYQDLPFEGGEFTNVHEQEGPSVGQDPTGPAIEATGGDSLMEEDITPQSPTGEVDIAQVNDIPTPFDVTEGAVPIERMNDIPTPFEVTGGVVPMDTPNQVAMQGFEDAQGQFGGETGMEGTGVIDTNTPMYNLDEGGQDLGGVTSQAELDFEAAQGRFGGQQGMEVDATTGAEITPDVPLYNLSTGGLDTTAMDEFENAQGQFGGEQGMEGQGTITEDTPEYDLNTGGISMELPDPLEAYQGGPSLQDVGAAVAGPVIQSLMGTLGQPEPVKSGGDGGSPMIQSPMSSTAGQSDPTSELQQIGTGHQQVNPALFSQMSEFGIDEEEEKKRKQLWAVNPLMA